MTAERPRWNELPDDEFLAIVAAEFASYPVHLRFSSRRLLWSEQAEWYLRMSRIGWIAPNWPVEHGGMGLGPAKLLIFLDEQERHGIARFQDHGIRMIGPALMRFGDRRQQERLLPPILRCEHRYCQGYSEPGSGSDLASVRTTARRDGDRFVLAGHKIWTTMAHDATHIFVLARTGVTDPPQAGITFLLVDLATPGITIRTIRDLAGHDELCEVIFDDVPVPLDNLVGRVDDGWAVAKSVLGFERVHVGGPQLPESGLRLLRRAVSTAGLGGDQSVSDRVEALALDVHHLGAAYRYFAGRLERDEPLGADVSMLKVWATETFQRIADAVVDVAGPGGGLRDRLDVSGVGVPDGVEVLSAYYRARPSTIYGGSSEIQRNILAKQVLHLPTA